MSEILFRVDTKHRKQWFTGLSFSHPAKMSLPLQLWIIEKWTSPGDLILDPMAGSGTLMVCCSLGRNCILVELEDKFCKMMEANWEKVKQRGCQLGYTMGTCQILQGDARNLEGLLVDKILCSPPYSSYEIVPGQQCVRKEGLSKTYPGQEGYNRSNPENIGNLPYGNIDKIITSPPYADQQGLKGASNSQNKFASQIATDVVRKRKEGKMGGHHASKEAIERAWAKRQLEPDDPTNLGNLPYGSIDKVITSPPYEGTEARDRSKESWWDEEREKKMSGGSAKIAKGYQADTIITSPPYAEQATHKNDIERELSSGVFKGRSYRPGQAYTDKVDAVISSPPYEGSLQPSFNAEKAKARLERLGLDSGSGHFTGQVRRGAGGENVAAGAQGYSGDRNNIGNLKSDSYLSAMLQVYQQCYQVLKDGGLLILVTKDFIRNKKRIDLAGDTIKLCEQAGFQFFERHYRKLSSQSFWRVIYKQKYPDAPEITTEDILVFRKG